MRCWPVIFCALVAACAPEPKGEGREASEQQDQGRPPETPLRPASERPEAASGAWSLVDGELTFADKRTGGPVIMLSCRANMLSVRLPGVRTIASEERLSVGGGGDVEALVVDGEDPTGVRASGPAPEVGRLFALLKAGPGASYGANAIGPLAPVPEAVARPFIAGCR